MKLICTSTNTNTHGSTQAIISVVFYGNLKFIHFTVYHHLSSLYYGILYFVPHTHPVQYINNIKMKTNKMNKYSICGYSITYSMVCFI